LAAAILMPASSLTVVLSSMLSRPFAQRPHKPASSKLTASILEVAACP